MNRVHLAGLIGAITAWRSALGRWILHSNCVIETMRTSNEGHRMRDEILLNTFTALYTDIIRILMDYTRTEYEEIGPARRHGHGMGRECTECH